MAASKPLVSEINRYLNGLNIKQQKAVLSIVKTFAEEQQDWWDEISQEQQQAIDKALAEMKEGKLSSHEEVMKSITNG